MQLALLIQVHDEIQAAVITDVGLVDVILELKDNLQTELNNLMILESLQSGIFDTEMPENAQVIYPTLHVLIADQQKVNNVVRQFQPDQMYDEIYDLVYNSTLIENY